MTLRNFDDAVQVIKSLQLRIDNLERAARNNKFDKDYYYDKVQIQKLFQNYEAKVKVNGIQSTDNGRLIFDFSIIVENEAIFNGETDFNGIVKFHDTIYTEDIYPEPPNTHNLGYYDDSDPLDIIDHRWLRLYVNEIRFWGSNPPNRPLRTDIDRNIIHELIDLSDNIDTIDPAAGKELKVESGGTGRASFPAGQILIGDGTNPLLTVTGASGSISISVGTTDLQDLAPTDPVVTSVSITSNNFTNGVRIT